MPESLMRFVDEAQIRVIGGRGGHGCVSFRREKFIPKGGPDGGDGGRGGSIYLEASHDVHTLLDFRYLREYRAKNGESGQGSQCYGRAAEDILLKVPVGTKVRSSDGEVDVDLITDGQRVLVAKGGKGGLGNIHFKSSTRQAPRIATPGEPGDERELQLELKLLSHIGLVGFPNAGKSTLLSAISSARPKIADYPFTTLTPQLGVVQRPDGFSYTVADIPGIIEGAHEGRGLGIQFLKHISRASALLIVLAFDPELRLEQAYQSLLSELKSFDPQLLDRPRLVCVNKSDLLSAPSENAELFRAEWEAFLENHPDALLISAQQREGLEALHERVEDELLKRERAMVS